MKMFTRMAVVAALALAQFLAIESAFAQFTPDQQRTIDSITHNDQQSGW